jgi:phosphatidylglycerol:prolipoprotein diacylglycerol transferase
VPLRIGPILIHIYPALINTGLLLGAVLVTLEARRRRLDGMYVLDAALAATVVGLILARAVYVGLHWEYYTNHPCQAVRLRDGGLSWHGALVGGTAGAALASAIRKKQLLLTLDVLTWGAASVAIFAWLGCLTVGCAHGMATFPWQGPLWTLSLDLPDLYGIREPRVAVQLLGAGWSALGLCATLIAQRRAQRSGMVFAIWLTLHSLGSFGLGFLRADEMTLMAGWRIDQLADLASGTAGIGAMSLTGLRARPGSGRGNRESDTEMTG